jgi:polysaccharide deacetylase family protein (PEP-CTERM system associated)
MLNALTIDVEDYFQVEAFRSHVRYEEWDAYPSRVERNVDRILPLLDETGTKATFFVLGWVAQRFPALVPKIAAAGHEVACHGYAHQRVHSQTPKQFRLDVRRAREQLRDQAQQLVNCYRAPSFSIVRQTMWAIDVLAEEGFLFDSSMFPVRHDLYGIPDGQRFPHWIRTSAGRTLFEFPPSTVRRLNNNWGVAGGGYLRFAPYSLTQRAIQRINVTERQPAMVYFHPWELDPEQPHLTASWKSVLRHYTNLSTTEAKIRQLLCDFRFTTVTNACQQHTNYNLGSRRGTLAASA